MKKAELNNQIIEKATEFGACAAGIADVEVLKKSPSHLITTACPQKAFQNKIHVGSSELQGRQGVYSRRLCRLQMKLDVENANKTKNEKQAGSIKLIKFCRLCETSCPIGKR